MNAPLAQEPLYLSSPAAQLAALRAMLARTTTGKSHGALPLGLGAIDSHLPWDGLALGCLHEIAGPAGIGFAVFLARRLTEHTGRALLWCRRRNSAATPYGPGLAAVGLPLERVILIETDDDASLLWAMEEGLRCPGLAAVVGEAFPPDLTASRRLQLAAERHGVTALLLTREKGQAYEKGKIHENGTGGMPQDATVAACPPSAAVTRWRLSPVPLSAHSVSGIEARWRLELLRCRAGHPGAWTVEWRHATDRFALAAAAGDRPAAAA